MDHTREMEVGQDRQGHLFSPRRNSTLQCDLEVELEGGRQRYSFDFSKADGSTDPMLVVTAAEVLNDITLAPTKDFVIISNDIQELVGKAYQEL